MPTYSVVTTVSQDAILQRLVEEENESHTEDEEPITAASKVQDYIDGILARQERVYKQQEIVDISLVDLKKKLVVVAEPIPMPKPL